MRYDGMSMVYDRHFFRLYDARKSEVTCDSAIMKRNF